ncbi:MAG TPA: competence protein ComK [Pseudogracilibacillus sp.]|nr:competence protein ComK [Pseudogracilibacillus sp.]
MDYIINEKTQAIAVMKSDFYRTKVYEMYDTLCIEEPPLRILENSCDSYGYPLYSWRNVIEETLDRKSKLPIPVSPPQGIFFVPTTSSRNKHCVWVSYYHISKYFQCENELKIILRGGQLISTDISLNQFKLQLKRTGLIIAYFYQMLYVTSSQKQKLHI